MLRNPISIITLLCGSSSFGRARPCQGRGGRFEPGLPLTFPHDGGFFLEHCPGGETGRHAGLKILWAARPVRVQLPPGAQGDLRIAFFMSFFVYIIYSPRLQRFYTGTTDDVAKRIEEHNNNKYPGSFTSKGIPWEPFFQIECKTSDQAYKLEKFIKKMKSTNLIKKLKTDSELLASILKKLQQ